MACDGGRGLSPWVLSILFVPAGSDDIPEIVEKHLIGGEVVARLLLPDQPHLQGRTAFPALEIGATTK